MKAQIFTMQTSKFAAHYNWDQNILASIAIHSLHWLKGMGNPSPALQATTLLVVPPADNLDDLQCVPDQIVPVFCEEFVQPSAISM
jgi:hypothetical protein